MDWYLLLRALFALFASLWIIRFSWMYRGWSFLLLFMAGASPIILAIAYWLDLLGVIADYLPYARIVALIIILSPVLAIQGVLLNERA